ncbi:MAG TPA: hypothetical protein ENG42_02785 [Candidatus Aenigmarchaeota archaeon]|nr:MAG: hypothetical protein DRP03_02240 [Candidatus Aenigmarchaeota archaeon]HDD46376.1 hypothetical protein [Candidatus Aenigmarchaeota archaeon]
MVEWKIYLAAGVITTIIFSMGIVFGFWLSGEKVQRLNADLESILRESKSMELEMLLMNTLESNFTCRATLIELDKITQRAAYLGDLLTVYENSERMKVEEYKELKKDYTYLLIRYWLFWKNVKKSCGNVNHVFDILYFYSNKNCSTCIQQGAILSHFKKLYPKNFMIFAIDGDMDLYIVRLLKEIYNVKSYPVIVVGDKEYHNFMSKAELENLFCTEYKEFSFCKR